MKWGQFGPDSVFGRFLRLARRAEQGHVMRRWQEGVAGCLLEKGIDGAWNDNNEYEIVDERAVCHGDPPAPRSSLIKAVCLLDRKHKHARILALVLSLTLVRMLAFSFVPLSWLLQLAMHFLRGLEFPVSFSLLSIRSHNSKYAGKGAGGTLLKNGLRARAETV